MLFETERQLSLPTKWAVLFGGFVNQFGWFFFGFGLIFFWVFGLRADLSALHFQGDVVKADGVITERLETNLEENESPVTEVHYQFTSADGVDFDSFSYTKKRAPEPGAAIVVEYPAGKPGYSRIEGMRREPLSAWALVVVIFPVVGLVMMGIGLRKSLHQLKLIKNGELAKGTLVSKQPTNTTINDQPVYRLTFRFRDQVGGEYEFTEKSHLTHLVEDEDEERLLYLASDPKCATLVDLLPGSLEIDEGGNVRPMSVGGVAGLMFVPVASVVGHGLYALSLIG